VYVVGVEELRKLPPGPETENENQALIDGQLDRLGPKTAAQAATKPRADPIPPIKDFQPLEDGVVDLLCEAPMAVLLERLFDFFLLDANEIAPRQQPAKPLEQARQAFGIHIRAWCLLGFRVAIRVERRITFFYFIEGGLILAMKNRVQTFAQIAELTLVRRGMRAAGHEQLDELGPADRNKLLSRQRTGAGTG
jgi:hypothetical protein